MFWIVILIIILSYVVILLIVRAVLNLINSYRNNRYAEKLSQEELQEARVRVFAMKSTALPLPSLATIRKHLQSSGSSKMNRDFPHLQQMARALDSFSDTIQTSLPKKGKHISKTFKGKLMMGSVTLNQDQETSTHQLKPNTSGKSRQLKERGNTGIEYCEVME